MSSVCSDLSNECEMKERDIWFVDGGVKRFIFILRPSPMTHDLQANIVSIQRLFRRPVVSTRFFMNLQRMLVLREREREISSIIHS